MEVQVRPTSVEKPTNTNFGEIQTVGGNAEFLALNTGAVPSGAIIDKEILLLGNPSVVFGPNTQLASTQPVVVLYGS